MRPKEKETRTKWECGVCENKRLSSEVHTVKAASVHQPVWAILQALAHSKIWHFYSERSRLWQRDGDLNCQPGILVQTSRPEDGEWNEPLVGCFHVILLPFHFQMRDSSQSLHISVPLPTSSPYGGPESWYKGVFGSHKKSSWCNYNQFPLNSQGTHRVTQLLSCAQALCVLRKCATTEPWGQPAKSQCVRLQGCKSLIIRCSVRLDFWESKFLNGPPHQSMCEPGVWDVANHFSFIYWAL